MFFEEIENFIADYGDQNMAIKKKLVINCDD
jgi:hypothetical protein